MRVNIGKGKYILAVSGGVDSMVLLDLLSKLPEVELVVAHFNHGMREDSDKDEAWVGAAAGHYGIRFESARAGLDKKTSEAAARACRYEFLRGLKQKYNSSAIITAHHQDDLIETAFINLLRGTGRRGLVSLNSNREVTRPLLKYGKKDILNYAHKHQIIWREDSTNSNDDYLRNYIRHHLVPRLYSRERQNLISNIDLVAKNDIAIDYQIAKVSQNVKQTNLISRKDFTNLPVELGNELVLYWLRQLQVNQADKKTVHRLNLALRASKPGTEHQVRDGLSLLVAQNTARFTNTL